MIRKGAEMGRLEKFEMRGGKGTVHMTQILQENEFMGKGRLFNRITLEPGCSIGRHDHHGEAEIFYILSGCATADDNGVPVRLEPGDMFYTADGGSHAIANEGSEPLEFIALILYA